MKKICAFLTIVLTILLVFACKLPSAVEVRKTVGLELEAEMDMGNDFSSFLGDGFGEGVGVGGGGVGVGGGAVGVGVGGT